jgi:hypothetical protein
MQLTQTQLTNLKENYTNKLLDGMDLKTLQIFAYETIMDTMIDWSDEDVIDEIKLIYDDNTAITMFEQVKN